MTTDMHIYLDLIGMVWMHTVHITWSQEELKGKLFGDGVLRVLSEEPRLLPPGFHLQSISVANPQKCKSQHHHQHSNVSPGTSPDNTAQRRLFCKLYSKKYSYMCIKCKGQKKKSSIFFFKKTHNTYQYIY